MIKNYIQIAFRSLMRNKVHSFINVAGLSIGISCCILIGLFVHAELTFDRFHSKADRIYRAYAIEDWGENQRFVNTTTPFPLGPAIKENFQEVELMVRIYNFATQVKTPLEQFSEQATVVGEDFLDMFDFELVAGNREAILSQQSSLLLTEQTAKRFFGKDNPLGKTLLLFLNERFESFTVTGVLKDPPENSSFRFRMVISELNNPRLYSERILTSAWFNISPETYILLKEGVRPESISSKFPSVFKPLLGDNYEKSQYFVGLQPFTSIHLDTSFPQGIAPVSDPKYSYILAAVAILILLVACINFVTLSIGRSLKRAKEVGIRKVAGAQRLQLVFQFIGEAAIVTGIALFLGIALAGVFLPLFNDLSGRQLSLQFNGFILISSFCLVAVIALFAGSYPAFILSGFRPASVLKGAKYTLGSKHTLRKILVGVQLMLSIFLISSTLLMKKQMQFLQRKNLGFNKEQLAVIPLTVKAGQGLRQRIMEGFRVAQLLKSELANVPQIASVCASSHDFGNGDWTNVGFTDNIGIYRTFNFNVIDADYIESMKIEVVSGRDFQDDNSSDERRSVIVNEAFVNMFGWSDAIGKTIPGKNFKDHEIVGVVKDFHYASLYTKVGPLAMAMDPGVVLEGVENINIDNNPVPKLLIRLRPGDASRSLSKIEKVWERLTGGEEFSFSFVDQRLAAQYRNDQNLEKIVRIAGILAIIIGSLGLYALAALAMQNRTKEISVRRVLGATERSILVLLSKDYMFLILVSLIFSIPFTWYVMRNWLMTFEYKVDIGADIFLIAGAISLLLALITIGYETFRAASAQLAQTLKYE